MNETIQKLELLLFFNPLQVYIYSLRWTNI